MDFYIDSFFMVNILMNFAVLYICAWLIRRRPVYFRLLLAAAVGSLYSCFAFLFGFDNQVIATISKVAVSLIMVVISFKYYGVKKLFETFVAFIGSGFLIAGAVLGLMFAFSIPGSFENGVINWQMNSSALDLFVALVLVFIIVKALIDIFRRKHIDNKLRAKIIVDISGNRIECEGLMDTGNDLRDPISGQAIVVLEYIHARELFDVEVRNLLDKSSESLVENISKVTDENIMKRFRLIPFSSLGNESGVLPGLRVDKLFMNFEGRWSKVENAVVCLSNQKLSTSGEYTALINPDIIKSLKRIGGDESVLKKIS